MEWLIVFEGLRLHIDCIEWVKVGRPWHFELLSILKNIAWHYRVHMDDLLLIRSFLVKIKVILHILLSEFLRSRRVLLPHMLHRVIALFQQFIINLINDIWASRLLFWELFEFRIRYRLGLVLIILILIHLAKLWKEATSVDWLEPSRCHRGAQDILLFVVLINLQSLFGQVSGAHVIARLCWEQIALCLPELIKRLLMQRGPLIIALHDLVEVIECAKHFGDGLLICICVCIRQ